MPTSFPRLEKLQHLYCESTCSLKLKKLSDYHGNGICPIHDTPGLTPHGGLSGIDLVRSEFGGLAATA